MTDAFVRSIVHIDEKRFPILRQRIVVHCISMILRGNETTFRPYHAHRLVMAAVSVFQFVYFSSSGFGKQLIAHADAEDRELLILHRLTDVLNGSITVVGIAGTIVDKQSVELQPVEIIVPGNADDFHPPSQQTADDVSLHTAIHKDNLL